jgi:hypothetical protein
MNCPDGYVCHQYAIPGWLLFGVIAACLLLIVGIIVLTYLDSRADRKRWDR